jgi:hypothetical protein
MISGADITIVKLPVSLSSPSATLIENLKEPTIVGVPAMRPLELRESPLGKVPELTEKL